MSQSPEALSLDLKVSIRKSLQWALAVGLVTVIATIFMPNYYQSEARLLPVDSKGSGNLGNLAAAAAAFGVSVPGGEGNDSNFVDILNSRSLREQLLQTQFHYHSRSWRFGAEQLKSGTLGEYLGEANKSRALRALGGVLSSSRDVKSKIITISAETKSPDLSQLIVQKSIFLLEAFLKEKGRTRGGAKVVFSEARLEDARREMNEAEDVWRRFLEINRNYQSISDPAVRLKGARLESELRLRQQLVSTLALNREQALLEEKNDIPILSIMDAADLPSEKSRPTRSSIVIMIMILVGIGTWLWDNRVWVIEKLSFDEGEDLVS